MKEILLAIGLGVAFLHVFYRAVESQWPETYFGGSVSTYAVNASPLRYLAFRFLPVYATCLFVAVTIQRLNLNVSAAVFGVVFAHAALTTMRGAWSQTLGGDRSQRSIPLLLLQLVVTAGFVVVALLAISSRSVLAAVVPRVAELAASLWTALLAGVVGAYLVKVSKTGANNAERMLGKSRATISPGLWGYAATASTTAKTDPDLVHAIMLVENLARPPWFRRVEQLKGVVFRHGTYGIMQVESSGRISDRESIDRAIDKRLDGVSPFTNAHGHLDYQALRNFAKAYNNDGDYADLVVRAYEDLRRRRSHP